MFQKTFVLLTLMWHGYYAKIASDLNNNSDGAFRIAGGYVPKVQTHAKYAVSIAYSRYFERKFGTGHFCTGSIIAPQTILTAAHCLQKKQAKDIIVIAGTPVRTKRVKSTQIVQVKDILPHPQFNYHRIDSPHDIGLLHLSEKIIEDNQTAQRIELATAPYVEPRITCLHVGWGKLGHNAEIADVIQYVDLVVFAQNVCNKHLGMEIEKMFCAGDPIGRVRGGCQGDSGGPLFCGGLLYGIDVLSGNCSKPGPTHFVEVSKYLDWIRMNSFENHHFGPPDRNVRSSSLLLRASFAFIFVIFLVKVV
ncbi:mast cell protease 2-like [Eurosta solidaginis]|uniref:mast cell protease 2-like n=1 Tax=Eurosta solidaginis TaxID=178769 RepID=UPI003531319D